MRDPVKAKMPLPRRVPPFVSRLTAAALLDLSGSGFNSWIKKGLLPPPMPGTPLHEPRWSWAMIERWLAGDRRTIGGDLFTPPVLVERPGNRPGPKPGTGGRPRKNAAVSQTQETANG